MCQLVFYKGKKFSTVGSLQEVLPNLVQDSRFKAAIDSDCLCPVDVPATAEANGMHVEVMVDGDFLLLDGPPPPDEYYYKISGDPIPGTDEFDIYPVRVKRKRDY